jgi:hypothetical protein
VRSCWAQWLTPKILARQEVDIGKITVRRPSWAKELANKSWVWWYYTGSVNRRVKVQSHLSIDVRHYLKNN